MTRYSLPPIVGGLFHGVFFLLMGLTVSPAHAERSPYLLEVHSASVQQALGQKSLPLLRVVPPAGGREGQGALLRAAIESSPDHRVHMRDAGAPRESNRSTLTMATDGSWYMEVDADGSRYRYRGDVTDDEEIARAGKTSLDMTTIERLGRAYITDPSRPLARLVRLSDNETLVFLGTKYMRSRGGSEETGTTDDVIANIGIFGREVHGTFVAGAGSKIAVWFSNSGDPVGFDVDWPQYEVSATSQGTLSIDRFLDRVSEYADSPLSLIQSNLDRFECGYADLGARKRRGAEVQTGCFLLHKGEQAGGVVYASAEVIPLGVFVVPDPGWPVTDFIAQGLPWDRCAATPRACNEPPPATLPVTIDIEPGGSPNNIDARSEGKIRVAILSRPEFDARVRVDRASLRFGRTGNETSLAFCNPGGDFREDVNGDGLADLVCHFDKAAAGFQHGDTQGVLTGRTHEDDSCGGATRSGSCPQTSR